MYNNEVYRRAGYIVVLPLRQPPHILFCRMNTFHLVFLPVLFVRPWRGQTRPWGNQAMTLSRGMGHWLRFWHWSIFPDWSQKEDYCRSLKPQTVMFQNSNRSYYYCVTQSGNCAVQKDHRNGKKYKIFIAEKRRKNCFLSFILLCSCIRILHNFSSIS